ncbi:MAG: hypothetical protein ACO1OQ_14570 [Rufibacter sp.]
MAKHITRNPATPYKIGRHKAASADGFLLRIGFLLGCEVALGATVIQLRDIGYKQGYYLIALITNLSIVFGMYGIESKSLCHKIW